MDDYSSSLFMQWAVNTLQNQDPGAVADDDAGRNAFPSLQALRDAPHADIVVELPTEAHKANSRSSGYTGGGGGISPDAGMEQGGCWSTSPNSGGPSAPAPSSISSGTGSNLPMGWNFSAVVSAQPSSGGAAPAAARTYERGVREMVYGSQPTWARASAKSGASTGPASSPYAQDHIMAERKRREKINQRFIELSTVIPGLKKMDKATILCDAARYVKELQERVKSLEAAGSNGRSIETVVLVKKLCIVAPDDNEGSPRSSFVDGAAPARNPLPEIEARFSENNVMVRIHCENGKGLVVRVHAEVEELHLRIVHCSVMPFTASTMVITITAKLEEGFTVTAEEIVGRLNATLYQHTEETRN